MLLARKFGGVLSVLAQLSSRVRICSAGLKASGEAARKAPRTHSSASLSMAVNPLHAIVRIRGHALRILRGRGLLSLACRCPGARWRRLGEGLGFCCAVQSEFPMRCLVVVMRPRVLRPDGVLSRVEFIGFIAKPQVVGPRYSGENEILLLPNLVFTVKSVDSLKKFKVGPCLHISILHPQWLSC